MMIQHLSEANEDYLKAIYELTRGEERATTSQLAEHINVSPASVTSMLQKMASFHPALVDYQKHRGVRLTEAGRFAALEVIRHHRLLEVFLSEILGFSWDEVHAEAERLEHCISEAMENRLVALLGDPQVDPHGAPIPSEKFHVKDDKGIFLSNLLPGQIASIVEVDDSNADLLIYLGEMGLFPETKITVLDYSPFDGNLMIRMSGQAETRILGPGITNRIFVHLIADD